MCCTLKLLNVNLRNNNVVVVFQIVTSFYNNWIGVTTSVCVCGLGFLQKG